LTFSVSGGKDLGKVLQGLKEHWSANDFKLTREDLIRELPKIMTELGLETKVPGVAHKPK
jgi:hypothetical protein